MTYNMFLLSCLLVVVFVLVWLFVFDYFIYLFIYFRTLLFRISNSFNHAVLVL